MKLTFLGGADEVGASCTLVEVAGRRLVFYCGVRLHGPDAADPRRGRSRRDHPDARAPRPLRGVAVVDLTSVNAC